LERIAFETDFKVLLMHLMKITVAILVFAAVEPGTFGLLTLAVLASGLFGWRGRALRRLMAALPLVLVGISVLLGLVDTKAYAQTLTTLYSFSGSVGWTNGPLTLIGNTLYGTTYYGGADTTTSPNGWGYGTIFSIPVTGGTPTVLSSCNPGTGVNPEGLTLGGDTFYVAFASLNGALTGPAAVCSLPVSGGLPTVLSSFSLLPAPYATDYPLGNVTLSGSTLYGVFSGDSDNGNGGIFSFPLTGGAPTLLSTVRGFPSSSLTLIGNTLYGTTLIGGAYGFGSFYSIPVTGGTPTVLCSFNGSDGSGPEGPLTLIGNTFYGTTTYGGSGFNGSLSSGSGTVFSVPVSGGTPTIVAPLFLGDLTLSGTAMYGFGLGAGPYGGIDSIPVTGGSPTVLATFNGFDGSYSNNSEDPGYLPDSLTVSGNTLYGVGGGTVFALNLNATPEPSTFVLLAAGAIALMSCAWRRRHLRLAALIAALALLPASLARADVFNMPAGQTSLQFVTVGDPGNAPDSATGNQYGAVPYTFNMGKYDVTLGQYVQFLNAVAASDTYHCYNSGMAGSPSQYPFGISQVGSPGSYTYAVTGSNPQAANMPVFAVSWLDAARFCNWMQNGQLIGSEGTATTENGTYTLNGDKTIGIETRNANATYFVPSENEWYKACYYVGGGTNAGYWTYPAQSDVAPSNSLALAMSQSNVVNYYFGGYTDSTNLLTPVGTFSASPGPYGTYDMGGDVWQWTEGTASGMYSLRVLRGGSFNDGLTFGLASTNRNTDFPYDENFSNGFRIASVPEPTSLALLLTGGLCLLGPCRRRKCLA
jgi:uncharacterized repeat protein (TIGR03803 family)